MATKAKTKKAPAKKAPAKKKPATKKAITDVPLAKKKPTPPQIETNDLKKLAEEMNDIMGLEPAIDPMADNLQELIASDIDDVLKDDPFSDESWVVLKKLGFGKNTKTDPSPKIEGKKPAKKKSSGPGVIASIEEFLRAEKKGISREELAEKLTKRFPEREPTALLSTVRTQVPGRMSKERGMALIEDNGKFTVK